METAPNLEKLPKSLELAKQLENTDDPEFLKAHLGELLDYISEDTHADLFEDVSQIYEEMKKERCLVRVEQLSRILAAIELGQPLEIGHKGETHYANAVIPEDEGIKLALAEGQSPGPVRTIVSFGKTLIGFKTDHLEVTEVEFPDDDSGIRDFEERKRICRHVEGELSKKDLKFMVMRIPRQYLDDKHLTEEELKETDFPFIFRAARF